MPKFEFVAEANVQPAVSGMQKLQAELGKTAIAGAKADSALAKSSTALGKTLPAGANQATNALTNLGRVVQDAPFGFIGIANNINPLLESFQRLKTETGTTGTAFKALASSMIGAGGLGLAVSVITSLLTVFTINSASAGNSAKGLAVNLEPLAKKAEEAKKSQKEFADATLEASKATLSEKENLIQLKAAYVSLSPEIDNITEAIVKQGTAQFLFDKKNTEIQKLLSLEIQKQIDLRKKQRPLAGVQEFSQDLFSKDKLTSGIAATKDSIRQINDLSFGLEDAFKKLFSRAIKVKPEKVEIEKPEKLTFFEPGLVKAGDLAISPKVVVTPKFEFFERDPNALKKALEEWVSKEKAKQIGEAFSSIINQTMQSAISSLADSLGNTLSGNGSFGDIFSGLYKVFGAGLKQLGQYLVKTYALIKAIEEVKFKNAAVGIAVGFALQILGATIEARVKSQNAFASGVRNFEGGFATVGERGQENIFLPRGSTVQPNNEVMAFGRGGITLMPSIAYDGTKFRLFLNEVDAKIGRNG